MRPHNSHSIDSTFNDNQTKEVDFKLNNVMTMEFYRVSIEDRKELLINKLPNLRHLILSSVDLPSTDNQLAQVLNKKIQRLDIDEYSQLRQLVGISYTYFSNVQYINFRLHYLSKGCEYYADIVMEILKNFQNLKTLTVYGCLKAYFYICDWDSKDLVGFLDRDYIHKNYEFYYNEGFCLFRKKLL